MSSTLKRPGRVTFVAVAMIVLGGIAVLDNAIAIPSLMSAANSDPPAQPAKLKPMQFPDLDDVHHAQAKDSPAYYPVQFATSIGRIVLGIAMFVCGWFALKLKSWARILAIVIVPLALVLSITVNAYEAILLPAKANAIALMLQPEEGPAIIDLLETIFSVVFGFIIAVSLGLSLVISLILFFMLLSSKTRAAFDPTAAAPLPDDEGEREQPKRAHYEGYEDDYPAGSSSSQTADLS